MQKESRLVEHLEKLFYFTIVCECKSISRASEKLKIAQPALSKSMKILEQALEVTLFKRERSGVIPTNEGNLLLETAREILNATARFESHRKKSLATKSLHLVTHEVLVPLISPSLGEISKHRNELKLQIYTNPSVSILIQEMEDFRADVGIMARGAPRKGLHFQSLFMDKFEFFCSRGFLQRLPNKEKPITFEILSELPIILAPHVLAGVQETLSQHLNKKGIHLAPRHSVQSHESVAAMAANGLGVGLIPRKIAQILQPGKLISLNIPIAGIGTLGVHEFGFYCRKDAWKKDELIMAIHDRIAERFSF